jgi:hypothetical protein
MSPHSANTGPSDADPREEEPVKGVRRAGALIVRHTNDAGEYLDRVGTFLRQRPVEHSVLLSTAAKRAALVGVGAEPDLWLWVEDDHAVVATAQHTPPHGAYLSTGPAEAMRAIAETLWPLRPDLPGVSGLDTAPQEFATQWSRLGGPQATTSMRLGLYAAGEISLPAGIPGRLRPATPGDAPLLRRWADAFFAESGSTSSGSDEIGPRIDGGLLVVWEVDGTVVSMAATTVAQGGVSRVHFVYTPPENRGRGYASVCVATLTVREQATPGRTCMLFTDLANPTSNGIYQAVGYRRAGDAVQLDFVAPKQDPDTSRA